MKVIESERGFEIIRFTDRYGKLCSLQQSSLADFEPPGSSAVWFGPDTLRMHLDVALVRELLPHLTAWVETGSFHIPLSTEEATNE